MDINQSLQPVVENLIEGLKANLEQELRDQVSREVLQKIASTELNTLVERLVAEQLQERMSKYNFEATTRQQLDTIVSRISKQVNDSVVEAANKQIADEISKRIASIDINTALNGLVKSKLEHLITTQSFPERSIPHTSIDFSELKLTGDQISGGIIEHFGSTGIEDLATKVQMTIMDQASAFEGPIWAPEVKVKGSLYVEGDLVANGDISGKVVDTLIEKSTAAVRNTLNAELFDNYSNIIFEKIASAGIDLDKITQGGREIVKGSQLGYHITDSNLQRVGVLRDLQTAGESYLCDTLYVTGRRVGVNTMDPSAALTVWDEEVEIIANKRKQDTAYVGTPRRQSLVLGSNNHDNLRLEVDGSVQVNNLTVGKMMMSSSPNVPNYEGKPGQVVWNEQPSLGGPMGWVCLGATRWANFGIID